ncbi:helix-turn-helix transcriptional regulator [Methylotetracoccus oryzae]|uniref:helix-turn-helix transcriptional regulator n=1 Tax=Methylotetracoccus oryzae TaxID=1919059 RepID=UPI001119AE2B|nr:WYL domain-containing protein [Methylotetracoccus oryzae]
MANDERLIALHRLLVGQRAPVSTARIQERLGCSRATVMRLIAELRDISGDPIPYDRFAQGFAYRQPPDLKGELSSPWLGDAELRALLAIRQQLEQTQPGLLAELLAPLERRLIQLLSPDGLCQEELGRRIRLLSVGRAKRLAANGFAACAEAVLRRRRLRVRYRSRTQEESLERELSPFRLVFYRDNWYLDAWCHLREGSRRFAVDRIAEARLLTADAVELPDSHLDEQLGEVFGIFSGAARSTAVLRFSALRARWVADEVWPGQRHARWLEDGRYELKVAYGDPTELVMEIMKYVPEVEVLHPPELRQAVTERLQAALKNFSGVS